MPPPRRISIPLLALLSLSPPTPSLAQNATCAAFQPQSFNESFYGFPQPFLPYFPIEGTQTFDDADVGGAIVYQPAGAWAGAADAGAVNKTLHSTTRPGASVSFTFTGSAIEWFGTTGAGHGKAKVTLDTDPPTVEEVDASSNVTFEQQRIWSKLDLPLRKYKLTIQNTGGSTGNRLDVDAFVVTTVPSYTVPGVTRRENSSDGWSLIKKGSSGVAAMQLTILSPTHALIYDKTEHNYASINGHPAWSALYDINTHAVRELDLQTNSYCASGAFLSNGTLISAGGNPGGVAITESPGEYHDLDGLMSYRLVEPCLDPSGAACRILDMVNASRVQRWYTTVLRISDGSALIIGGSVRGAFANGADINEPSVSFFPKHPASPDKFPVPFFNRTLNANLFPHAFSLPNERAFIIANTESMILNWGASAGPVEEKAFPLLNGIRVNYPMSGTALLLPLSSADNYTSRILLCGGSDAFDQLCDFQYSSTHPASAQCARIEITRDGATKGWTLDDPMAGGARVMPDGVVLPTGEVVVLNGARTGYAGIDSVIDPVVQGNAAGPALSPILYSPGKAPGARWRELGVQSDIPRLYHSATSLTPNGDIMITGSNPNQDRTVVQNPAEYRVEWLRPPYMGVERPVYTGLGRNVEYGAKFTLNVTIPRGLDQTKIKVSLMDLGYSTHSVHMNNRLVFLESSLSGNQLTVTAPPDEGIYPPGPGYIFVVVDNVASKAVSTLVGDGKAPPLH